VSEDKGLTRDEARRRAVEAAIDIWSAHYRAFETGVRRPMEEAIATYERAMADAGWRMVRDVAAIEGVGALMVADNDRMRDAMVAARAAGWNACRAKMLGEDTP